MRISHVKLENENFVDAGIASNDVAGTCSTVFFFFIDYFPSRQESKVLELEKGLNSQMDFILFSKT